VCVAATRLKPDVNERSTYNFLSHCPIARRFAAGFIGLDAYTDSLNFSPENSAMKSHTKHLTFNVPERMGFANITSQVEDEVKQSGVREGLCLVNAMHITASVFINDDEPGLHEDYKRWLEWLAPFRCES
jgi:Uncharacterised protein family UPF0047